MIEALLEEIRPVGILASLVAFALAYIHYGMTPIFVSDHWDMLTKTNDAPDLMTIPGLVLIFVAIAWVFAEDRI